MWNFDNSAITVYTRRGVAVTSLGISANVFGGQTTSLLHQATQANSASDPQRDGK